MTSTGGVAWGAHHRARRQWVLSRQADEVVSRTNPRSVTGPITSVEWQPVAWRRWQGARPYQEDDFGLLEGDFAGEGGAPAVLMVLADGMGGEVGGATASHCVVQAFERHFPASRRATDLRLNECLTAATRALHDRISADPELDGMGSTVVAALYDGRHLSWLSVGDSPMWLFTGGRLVRLNADHSMGPFLDRLAELGEISPEEARRDGRRHMLRSAVTGSEVDLIDSVHRSCRLGSGDCLLLASDGLQTLTEEEIERLLGSAHDDPEAAADALLSAVRAAAPPNQDNVTFLVLAGAAGRGEGNVVECAGHRTAAGQTPAGDTGSPVRREPVTLPNGPVSGHGRAAAGPAFGPIRMPGPGLLLGLVLVFGLGLVLGLGWRWLGEEPAVIEETPVAPSLDRSAGAEAPIERVPEPRPEEPAIPANEPAPIPALSHPTSEPSTDP